MITPTVMVSLEQALATVSTSRKAIAKFTNGKFYSRGGSDVSIIFHPERLAIQAALMDILNGLFQSRNGCRWNDYPIKLLRINIRSLKAGDNLKDDGVINMIYVTFTVVDADGKRVLRWEQAQVI